MRIKNTSPYSIKELRRLNMQQQGLLGKRSEVVDVISQLSYVQIDSINVAQRAHEHVLFNRVKHYSADDLASSIASKEVFEYWSHAAAYLPMQDYRYSLFRKQQYLKGESHWHKVKPADLKNVRAKIELEGPLKAIEFEHSSNKTNTGWWDWKPAKKALEQLFMQGEIMAVRRDKFQKVYDLTERVLPSDIDTSVPTEQAFARYLIDRCITAHGFATAKQIAYLRKGCQKSVRNELLDMCESGELSSFELGKETYYFNESITPPTTIPDKVYLLNPFDNIVIQRDRLLQCFDFNYQIEVYVPQAKRKYGYYSLPILWRDRFVGRVDVKADRKQKVLLLQHLSIEDESLASLKSNDSDVFIHSLRESIEAYREFNQCEVWELVSVNNQALYERLCNTLDR
ncbi:hypothetical protein KUL10_36110 [Glaciecola sp. KUL10]|nr:hypothetical protein KUL10_36110 [Glaciecola sp. KUL10]